MKVLKLGDDFSEEHLKKVIAGEANLPENKTESREPEQPPKEKRRFDLVIDIQEKMAQGKNGGYVRWAKKYNVKQFAESILFLQQHDIHDKETRDAGLSDSEAKTIAALMCRLLRTRRRMLSDKFP